MLLAKVYDPKPIEPKMYRLWERLGCFNPDRLRLRRGAKPYVVYMPLPNVTGTLHMGHALDNTLQDILIRYHRMRGFRALWLPGTDHAGIATQYSVEKELKKHGQNRFELGREKFIEQVWAWKERYGNIILGQLKRLGVSCDWSRVRFTMDRAYSRDVLAAFLHYHRKGLLYRGLRTVNWCPRCQTSLSELELEYTEERTTLYHIRYGPFTLATTRPETKFGDTALAVHPKDARYQRYVGGTLQVDSLDTAGTLERPRTATVTLTVIADEAVDPAFGTGVVKVTPAHDTTDFEIGERHRLPAVQVIDGRGRMNERAGKYAGMKTGEARKKIVEDLRATGLLVKEEPYDHRVARCYRCGTVIEPIPSAQWFLRMEALAKRAIGAVRSRSVRIFPKRFEKPYLDWLTSMRDWTVSRQIWWGHRLPVWFCTEHPARYAVSLAKPKRCPACHTCPMAQSEEVLDTWFSSALWPFAGLSSADQRRYYPGNTVTNARDILNLWDARMIFSGLEFKGKVPFRHILIHGTVLTKEGARMSKSLGTGLDPARYIDQYGADATRFAVIWQANGQDIRWDEAAVIAGRKFTNKIWNASRFVQGQVANLPKLSGKPRPVTTADRKVFRELSAAKRSIGKRIDAFEFSKALHELYHFFWHQFCDSYLEQSKPQLAELRTKATTEQVLAYTLRESLRLLHPFLPFISEAIFQELFSTPAKGQRALIVEPW